MCIKYGFSPFLQQGRYAQVQELFLHIETSANLIYVSRILSSGMWLRVVSVSQEYAVAIFSFFQRQYEFT
jgi:hypothetical protein